MLLAESLLERNGTLFQIIATVAVAAVAGLGGWWLRSRSRTAKTFDFRILSDLAILSHRPDDNALKVVYNTEELLNPRLVRARFTNSGTDVIRASEVLEPFVFVVHAAWLVSVEIAETSSASLASFEATWHQNEHAVALTLATLNPGDNFTLQMIVDSAEPPEFSLSGRIEGQTRPAENMRASDLQSMANADLAMGIVGLAVLSGLGAVLMLSSNDTTAGYVVSAVPLLGGLIFGTWAFRRSFALRRRVATGDFMSSSAHARGEADPPRA